MQNTTDNPSPRSNARAISWIIAGEFVLLLVMLGVWGFSRLEAEDPPPAPARPGSVEGSDRANDTASDARPGSSPAGSTAMDSDFPAGTAEGRHAIEFRTLQPATEGETLAEMPRGPESTPGSAVEPPTVAELYRRVLPPLEAPVILVEKTLLRLTVFDGKRPVKIYKTAVGGNDGHKQREGDLRTPEGEYYVCVRKTAPATPYTCSLGLSYPNVHDAERALAAGRISRAEHDAIAAAIREGRQPPWTTPLGGAIMIHGKRNGGRDTQGCIALEDEDIRELYPRIPNGTRVIIRP